MQKKPDPQKLGKLGGALRHWYFSVGIEMETLVEANYPATAEASIHDVVHQLLDPIDKDRFPRVVCNLVGNLTPWPEAVTLCALPKPARVRIKPVKETTFLPKRRNVLKT